MKRELNYKVGEEWAGKQILDFLRENNFSKNNIIALKKTQEGILLNGKWAYVNQILNLNDVLSVRIVENESSEHILPIKLPFPIVYEDNDIVVVNKPANMPIHPSLNNYENTLGNAAAFYFKKKGENFVFRCVNRLDRDTTGLTILAKHSFAANGLNAQMLKREIKREYFAIVEGVVKANQGKIEAPIGRVDGSTIEREVNFETGEYALTNFWVVKRFNHHSLLRLTLETGRTHQIRVHMKYLGHPLIGDFLYNSDNSEMERQALHAGKISFKHPVTGEEMHFEAKLPEDMSRIINSFVFL